MDHHAGRSSRMSGRQKGRRINQPTHAKTHGWVIMAGLSNCLSSASGKHGHTSNLPKSQNSCQASSFFTLISSTSEEIQKTGPWPPVLATLSRRPSRRQDADAGLEDRHVDEDRPVRQQLVPAAWRGENGPQEGGTCPGPAKPPRSCSESARPLAMMTSRLLVTNSGGMPWLSRLRASRSLTRAWRSSISGEARRPGRHRSDARPHRSACQLPHRPPAER